MEIQFNAEQQVRIPYRIGDFSDCLYKTPAEYAALTEADLRAEMQQRHANWLAAINAVPPAPTPEDVQAQLDALVAQQAATQEQIVAIAPPEIVVPILEAQATTIAGQIAALTAE